ncbi:MAG: amidase family protein [Acinetobacter sp.]
MPCLRVITMRTMQNFKNCRLIQQDFLKAFENVDVIAAPSAPTTAYKIGANLSPTEMYLGDIYTLAVNLAGLPAIKMHLWVLIRQLACRFTVDW